MSENNIELNQEKEEIIEEKPIDETADLKRQVESMRGKIDELLSEAKKAKQQAREASAEKERVRLEKAKKEGDFEQLLKSSEKERSELSEKLNRLQNQIKDEKISVEAMKAATELADGPNAEILSEFIKRRLSYSEDGLKVLNSQGELTVSSLDELKREFQSSDKFKSLLRGTKASGGGAVGGPKVSNNKVTMKRSDFDAMPQPKKIEFFKNGGSVED